MASSDPAPDVRGAAPPASGPEAAWRRNQTVSPREPHAELLDAATHDVWLAPEPMVREELDALVLEPPLVKTGVGRGVMDRAGFLRSPGDAVDGPLRERIVGGRRWQLVARPDLASGPRREGGARVLLVHKHHVLEYDAGREVEILRLPDGALHVHTTAAEGGDRERRLPEGWATFRVHLDAIWTVVLPSPTTTIWFAGHESFQGPLRSLP